MKILAWIPVVLGLAACQQDNKALERKIDDLNRSVAAMDAKLANMQLASAQAPKQRQRRPEPDPKDVYAVPIAGEAVLGPEDALVTIVEGYEYACPACQKVRATVAAVRAKYPDQVRVVPKQYLVHPDQATAPALAICAATRQGKFEAMDKLLWEKGYAANRDFSPANLDALAAEAGLDVGRYKQDMEGDCKAHVAQGHKEMQTVGQGATPTFFINGRYLVGVAPQAQFEKIIEEELRLAEERVAAGTPKAAYYATWVLEKGKKKFVPPPPKSS